MDNNVSDEIPYQFLIQTPPFHLEIESIQTPVCVNDAFFVGRQVYEQVDDVIAGVFQSTKLSLCEVSRTNCYNKI